jgi:hypothetical protein
MALGEHLFTGQNLENLRSAFGAAQIADSFTLDGAAAVFQGDFLNVLKFFVHFATHAETGNSCHVGTSFGWDG